MLFLHQRKAVGGTITAQPKAMPLMPKELRDTGRQGCATKAGGAALKPAAGGICAVHRA